MNLTKKLIELILCLGKFDSLNKKITGSKVSKQIKRSQSDVNRIINKLFEKDLLLKHPVGRENELELTDKGKKVVNALLILKEVDFQ